MSLVHNTVHIGTKTCMKIVSKQRFLPNFLFLDILPQKYAKTSHVFQIIAILKSMTMQKIFDFMHFHTTALRQKNAVWKVDGYNIRSVYYN